MCHHCIRAWHAEGERRRAVAILRKWQQQIEDSARASAQRWQRLIDSLED